MNKTVRIMCIDPGYTTGIAWADFKEGEMPSIRGSGQIRVAMTPKGKHKMTYLETCMKAFIDTAKPDRVIMEDRGKFIRQRGGVNLNVESVQKHSVAWSTVEKAIVEKGIPIKYINTRGKPKKKRAQYIARNVLKVTGRLSTHRAEAIVWLMGYNPFLRIEDRP